MKGRDLVLAWSWYYKNHWKDVYDAISKHAAFDESKNPLSTILGSIHSDYVTLIDADYPQPLLKSSRPPFVLFYKGDLKLLQEANIESIISISAHSSIKGIRDYEKLATIMVCKEANEGAYFFDLDAPFYKMGMNAFLKARNPDAKSIVFSSKQSVNDFLSSCPLGMKPDLVLSTVWDGETGDLDSEVSKYVVMATFAPAAYIASAPKANTSSLAAFLASVLKSNTKVVVPYPVFDTEHINNRLIAEGYEIFCPEQEDK